MTGPIDKTLCCRDCGASFVFSVREQQFYAERGFTHEPGRCPDCRAAGQRRQGRGGYAGTVTPSGLAASDTPRPRFSALCTGCGRPTRVTFAPQPGRPVYCDECYAEIRERRRFR